MKLWINENYCLSVIENESGFSCQVMEPISGIGMFHITKNEIDRNSVFGIVYDADFETSMICTCWQSMVAFHEECFDYFNK